jgi:hypothetical protein
MAKNTILIGRTVKINIPLYGIYGLPAKVDTGADGSSIWASDIEEDNGILSFFLLDPRSDKYNGQKISTKEYKRVIVKNSFGVSERRYRVFLTVEIEGRKIKAQFSLANRQLKSYPALIGRRLLSNRFIVDVAKK